MKPQATGQIVGNDLILTRAFQAPIEDVWTSITDPGSTARWFGRWEGDAGPGKVVRLQMAYEKDQPWMEVTIEECEAPRRLVLVTKDEGGEWRVEITLSQTGTTTTLRFAQHLSDLAVAGEVGPGWEYYLDMLVAARDGTALPRFEDYYPAQKPHYSRPA